MPDSSDGEIPQLPREQTGECPVCGERYFRYEPTEAGQVKEGKVPFCFKSIEGSSAVGVYYHA